ncbi:hypothetical protein TH66_02250 [Carbonactinospora thermoautotrophica]|uniref:Uncharacterized protein n=1 Tax=Carbonactinospora thermoautotrophica TaxID=1469144 RepID=A0A132N5R4_9ACTN|nr:hypothetical protein TR74_23710 [Carbonactinospora thermoautotrophica]KWX05598.1 hypothetical protein TH66_02250 [Carbonactinospora thermoautotrophica]
MGSLTGIRSSKPTFYAEYRHTAESLDRTMRSLDRIARVLVSTAKGSADLCAAVVEAAGEHLDAEWVVLGLRRAALPDATPRFLARDPSGRILSSRRRLPPSLRRRFDAALSDPHTQVSDREVFVPLRFDDTVQGALAAWRRADSDRETACDEIDLRVLTILANQALVCLQKSDALGRVKKLLSRTEELYAEAEARARDLAERNRQLQEARSSLDLARQREVIDHERRRLARELHDSVAQHILSAGMAIEWCRAEVAQGSPVRDQLEHAKQLTRVAVEQLRSAIYALSDADAPQGTDLPDMLNRLRTFHSPADFDLRIRIEGRPVPLDPAARSSLFRIASECLFNTAVHAEARRAIVRLVYRDDILRLLVADDGCGHPEKLRRILRCQVPGAGNGYHHGLLNMAQRAAEMGGTLTINRARLGGVCIEVSVPLARIAQTPAGTGGTDV